MLPTIVHIGQLSGGINGTWKTSEWVPAMISTSWALSCLPDEYGVSSYLALQPITIFQLSCGFSEYFLAACRYCRGRDD